MHNLCPFHVRMNTYIEYLTQYGDYCFELYPYQTKDWMAGKERNNFKQCMDYKLVCAMQTFVFIQMTIEPFDLFQHSVCDDDCVVSTRIRQNMQFGAAAEIRARSNAGKTGLS